jgi:tetratricopeptide (TPR) repeat protein
VKYGHTPAQLNRGWAYELKGDYKKAAADYADILNLRPADALALNNLAWLRASCPDAKYRDGKEAVKLAKQVCELSGNREGTYLDTCAAALAEAGDFAAAVKSQELALEDGGFAKKHGDDAQKRLQLYKDKKPFRSKPLK